MKKVIYFSDKNFIFTLLPILFRNLVVVVTLATPFFFSFSSKLEGCISC